MNGALVLMVYSTVPLRLARLRKQQQASAVKVSQYHRVDVSAQEFETHGLVTVGVYIAFAFIRTQIYGAYKV
jgi:hypothetical protein